MPLQKLQFRPGVNRESTTLANEGGWFESDKVRFRSGYPEKIGGWVKDQGVVTEPAVPPTGMFWGICRSMWNWVSLNGFNLLSIATNLKFYIQNGVGGDINDITPLRTTTIAGQVTFTATPSSSVIKVTNSGWGGQTGDFVTFTGAVSLGGNITAAILNSEFQITYISPTQYSITASVTANGSDVGNGGASTVAAYQISTGADVFGAVNGWGAGTWGGVVASPGTNTGWGEEAAAGISVQLRTWSQSNFGQDLIFNPRGGPIYYWTFNTVSPTQFNRGVAITQQTITFTILTSKVTLTGYLDEGTGVTFSTNGILPTGITAGVTYYLVATGTSLVYTLSSTVDLLTPVIMSGSTSGTTYMVVADAPSKCNFVMVSDASRFVLAFGVNDYGSVIQDPMLVRWSDQENPTVWTPSITNQAGSYRLSRGSQIVTAIQTRQEVLVLTDAAIYSMQYLGAPYVWGVQIMGDNISILGPNTAVTVNNVTYWMGVDKFYMYTGRVETLPCTLRQYIYDDINITQGFQAFGGTNEGYNEIWWFYCSAASSTVDKYVVYNHLERTWYYGTMARSSWLDSPLRSEPMATPYAGTNGQLVYHETGNDDGTVDPALPITAYVQSADFDIGDGHNFGFVWRLIPDITFDGSNVNKPQANFTVRPRQFPGTNYGTSDNPAVKSTQNYTGQQSYNVQQFTEQVYVRLRGRQMAFRVESDQLGVSWQLGTPRMDVRPDGRR
jgi:hypothetical protein